MVIIPGLKTKITSNDGHDFTCVSHFFYGLLSVSAVVLVAFIKTLSHKNPLDRDAVGLKIVYLLKSGF